MTDPASPPERFGPLVRRDHWEATERSAVDGALEYAEDMLDLNLHLVGDLPLFYWWEYFDYALLGGYPGWKWEREPQLGLEEWGVDSAEGSP